MLVDAAEERYASALFELAKEKGQMAEIDGEIRKAALMAQSEQTLTRALVAPDIPENVKRDIVNKVYGTRVSPMVLHFLQVLVDGQRFAALSDVATRYHGLLQDAQGQVQVDVETAVDLSADLKQQVEAQVVQRTGRKPQVKWHVEPDILGGVVIRIKDNLIDYSLKRQLHEMRERLLRGPV